MYDKIHYKLKKKKKEALILFCFLPLGWYHLYTEVVSISPDSLDSSLWFIQLSILHDVLLIMQRWQYGNMQSWCTPFTILNQTVVWCLVPIVASWPAYRFLRGQERWPGTHIFKNSPQFVVIHTVKGISIVNEAKVDVFLKFPWFLYDPTNVAFLFLFPLLNFCFLF